MDYYSKKEFETMQQEAIRRVKEMHKRAQNYVKNPPESEKFSQNSSQKKNNVSHSNNNSRNNNSYNRNFHNSYPNRNNMQNFQHSNNNGKKQPPNRPQNFQNRNQMNGRMNPNYQHMPMGNPFAQLFGSNLGGFKKFKNMFNLAPNSSSSSNDSSSKPFNNLLNGVLKDFNIDEEKIILGILIYLLYKNGSDTKLLLALGYLLL